MQNLSVGIEIMYVDAISLARFFTEKNGLRLKSTVITNREYYLQNNILYVTNANRKFHFTICQCTVHCAYLAFFIFSILKPKRAENTDKTLCRDGRETIAAGHLLFNLFSLFAYH